MSQIDQETKEKMLEALKKFLQEPHEAKDFAVCMSESNDWLQKQGE